MKQFSILQTCMTAYSRQAETRATTKPKMAPSEHTCPEATTEQGTRDCAAQQNPPTSAQITDTPATYHRWLSSPSLGVPTIFDAFVSVDAATPALNDKTLMANKSDVFHFFKLSGELRNKIYRYAILQDTPIYVGSAGHQRSSLMAVSKQAHSETLKIFYLENNFTVNLEDYNSDTLLSFTRVMKKLRFQATLDKMVFSINYPNWKNLMVWLERHHSLEIPNRLARPSLVERGSRNYTQLIVLGGLFHIVSESKGQPWARVKEMVLELRLILVDSDARWAQD